MLKGLLILIGFQLAGDFISSYFQLPFPGSVIGMGLLFVFLCIFGKTPKPLKATSSAIFPYIPLFLMPACVGAMSYWGLLKDEWVALILALTVSTIVAIITIPHILRVTLSMKNRKQ
ncbi:hypothetical protein A9Q99_20405 [Gammaproteobacteria bacterium 45_16_T64]|nr:hypothetical protein A9Q99_20405 [Gammaproteobacteria bacterium 45_16_T64]